MSGSFKRRLSYVLAQVLLVIILLGWPPHYKILSQVSTTSVPYRETMIVAVCQGTGSELFETGKRILRQYEKLNYGVPVAKVTIKLYRNKQEMDQETCSAVYVFVWNGD